MSLTEPDNRQSFIRTLRAVVDPRGQAVSAHDRLYLASRVPTLIVWGTDDVYFDVKWSQWLARTIPGTRRRIELEGARIFLAEERWRQFNGELRTHWAALPANP